MHIGTVLNNIGIVFIIDEETMLVFPFRLCEAFRWTEKFMARMNGLEIEETTTRWIRENLSLSASYRSIGHAGIDNNHRIIREENMLIWIDHTLLIKAKTLGCREVRMISTDSEQFFERFIAYADIEQQTGATVSIGNGVQKWRSIPIEIELSRGRRCDNFSVRQLMKISEIIIIQQVDTMIGIDEDSIGINVWIEREGKDSTVVRSRCLRTECRSVGGWIVSVKRCSFLKQSEEFDMD